LEFKDNPEITRQGVEAINNLIICQLEASKVLAEDPALKKVTLLNEVKWSKGQKHFVTPAAEEVTTLIISLCVVPFLICVTLRPPLFRL
jgi:hypothetical protein